MDPTLSAFVRAHFVRYPAGLVPLLDFAQAFRESLPDPTGWTRARLVAELTNAGFPIGVANRVQSIGGLAPRNAHWQAVNGRLERAHA